MPGWIVAYQTTTYYTANVIHAAPAIRPDRLRISVPLVDLTLDNRQTQVGLEAQQVTQVMPAQTFTRTDVVTIEEALEQWVALVKAEGQSRAEVICKRGNVRWYAKTCGWETLDDITARSINEARVAMAGKSSKTAKNYFTRLNTFLEYCVINEWLPANPAANIKSPKAVRGEGVRALSTDEVERLIMAVPKTKQWRKSYYAFAAWTGLRVGECRRLLWKHVVLSGEYPHLELPPTMTKNKKHSRLPLNKAACGALAAIAPPLPSPNENVFQSVPAFSTFNRDLERAGIPKYDERGRSAGLHSLRKHLATYLEVNGTEPTVIQSIMRHAKLELTRNAYMDDRLMNLAVRGMNALTRGEGREDGGFFSEKQLDSLTDTAVGTDTGSGCPTGLEAPDTTKNSVGSPSRLSESECRAESYPLRSPGSPASCGGPSEYEAAGILFEVIVRWLEKGGRHHDDRNHARPPATTAGSKGGDQSSSQDRESRREGPQVQP